MKKLNKIRRYSSGEIHHIVKEDGNTLYAVKDVAGKPADNGAWFYFNKNEENIAWVYVD